MNKIVQIIKKRYEKNSDLIIKEIKFSLFTKIYIIYLETTCSSNKVNDYILKNLTKLTGNIITNLSSYIPGPNTKIISIEEIDYYLSSGFTCVIEKNQILAIETRADINRNVSTPDSQPSIVGSKDAFTENYQINLGLIKRRIKTNTLKTENYLIGKRTKTTVGIIYFDDIIEKKILNDLKLKLENIDIDGIIDSSTISLLLQVNDNANFPTVVQTERPDTVCKALLEGKIAIIVDTSPFVLIIPAFFSDFINNISDNYSKNKGINFVKLLRLFCFLLSAILPAFYISLTNYNQESIPTSLLINFIMQRSGVPFPAIVEAFIMIITYEILRESDLRFPSSYGSAISILGALILGEAAVSAGIVSPIMIIVVALTFISSLVFNEYEFINALRHYRFVFLILAAFYGILGIVFAGIYFLIRINSTFSFSKPYFFPIAPYDKTYLLKTLLRKKTKDDKTRTKMLAKKNIVRQR